MTPQRLYINIDHVATVRQARRTDEPDPLEAARARARRPAPTASPSICARTAATSRMTTSSAWRRPSGCSTSSSPRVPTCSALACRLRPYQATIVPERREEVTTEGGLDLSRPEPAACARPFDGWTRPAPG